MHIHHSSISVAKMKGQEMRHEFCVWEQDVGLWITRMCHRGSQGISHVGDAVNLHLSSRGQTPAWGFRCSSGLSFSVLLVVFASFWVVWAIRVRVLLRLDLVGSWWHCFLPHIWPFSKKLKLLAPQFYLLTSVFRGIKWNWLKLGLLWFISVVQMRTWFWIPPQRTP